MHVLADTQHQLGYLAGELGVVALLGYGALRLLRRPGARKGFALAGALVTVLAALLGATLARARNASQLAGAGPTGYLADQDATAAGTVANPFRGLPPTTDIYILPLDRSSDALLAATVPTLRRWVPSAVELHTIPTPAANWANRARGGEWNATNVARSLIAEFKRAQGGRQVFLLAVTSQAIYDSQTPAYAFVFGQLWWRRPQFAAVFGTRPMRVYQPNRERARLTKMMLRYIGEIVCNLPRNNNPRSVLYNTIMGTPDLDRMVARLPSTCRG